MVLISSISLIFGIGLGCLVGQLHLNFVHMFFDMCQPLNKC